jgi:O-antigen/teichoic acid export membrane protein
MSSLDDSLVKITKGSGIALMGTFAVLLLGFISRPMIARFATEAEYGVYSLALTVLNIGAVVAALGLQQGIARSIAYARGKKDTQKVEKLIPASVQFGLIGGISLGIIIFFTADILAARVFHDTTLAYPLKIFAAGIPFFTLINVFVSVFRGFGDVKPMVYFQIILRPLLFLLFLLPVVFLKLPFNLVFYAFVASLAISFAVLIVYTVRRLPVTHRFRTVLTANPVAKELLLFSLPLLGVAVLGLIIHWTDTLMLGGMKSSTDVGLYNAAYPLSQFISAPLTAMTLIYVPVVSGLYAQGLMPEIKRNFAVLTKWLWAATLPLALILLLFPDTVLGFLFGSDYAPAVTVLRVLAVGYIMNNLMGPNGPTLITIGAVRFVMWTSLATALLNIGLNFALIPPYGIEGAAIASMVSLVSINLVRSWRLHGLTGAQPLSRNLLKPTLASLALVFLFQFIFGNFVTVTWWMLPLLFILYYVIYGLAILFTRSFDKEDISMLLAMEKRLGFDLRFIKRIIQRFL